MASQSTITSSPPAEGPSTSAFTIAVEPTSSSMTATTLVHDPSTSTSSTLPSSFPSSFPKSTTAQSSAKEESGNAKKESGNVKEKDVKKTLPKIIPPPKDANGRKRPRTLVLCFDGTGDQFDADVRSPLIVCCFPLLVCHFPSIFLVPPRLSLVFLPLVPSSYLLPHDNSYLPHIPLLHDL